MGIGARGSRMAHPDLLIGPSLLLRAGLHRQTEQGPLRAQGCAGGIDKVRRQVPPLDAKLRMRTMIGRKGKCLAGSDSGESLAADAKPGKALRKRGFAAEPQNERAARKGAA